MNDASSTLSQLPEQEAATPQQVADFLLSNPDFLEEHSYLLTELTIKHQSGQSISLVERQVAALRQENKQLKQQLSTLISNAQQNDQLLEKTKVLLLQLINSEGCSEIQSQIEFTLQNDFGSSACKLLLITNEEGAGHISYPQIKTELSRFLEKERAYCGLLREQEKQLLFTEQAKQVGSAAVLPLRNNGELIALLAIGNADKDYYRENMSTSLLDYIGEVTSNLLTK